MPFVNDVIKQRSLSIVGLEKNTGKTVCLNYLLKRLSTMSSPSITVTSIGVDGEQTDSVYATAKPEITLYDGMRFVTSEKHYLGRQLVSRIVNVDERRTALGRLVTADVVARGKILLSGPSTTEGLQRLISAQQAAGIDLTIVDGALSRLSLASPTVTDALILATGAAVSPNLQQLVSKTRFVQRLINLPEVPADTKATLSNIDSGLWALDNDGVAHDLHIASAFLVGSDKELFAYGDTFFSAGAASDRLLKLLTAHSRPTTLIVRDFTKLFISPDTLASFQRKGGKLLVLQRSNLLAISFNPTSPQGYCLDSRAACETLASATGTPVYDVMQCNL